MRDGVGNASSESSAYSVRYAAEANMCLGEPGHQILQPVNADGTSIFKRGRTVPAKFRVCDYAGQSVGAGVVADFRLVQKISGTLTETVNEAALSATPDPVFRWDSANQHWIFNMSTDNLAANATYVYRISLNDGTAIQFQFGLK